MTEKNEYKKLKILDAKTAELNQAGGQASLSKSLDENIRLMKQLFTDTDTFMERQFANLHDPTLRFCIFYTEGLANTPIINEHILSPLMVLKISNQEDVLNQVENRVVQVCGYKNTGEVREIIESVTYGDTILFVEGYDKALILSSKNITTRAVAEPDSEKIISGPREGFVESLPINLSLIRRRLRTNELKIRCSNVGRITQTRMAVCYIDSLVNKKILQELLNRLSKIDIDGALDTNYINELIKDAPYSLFQTTGITERPDVAVAKLLEGRIAIILDGTPVVLTVPYLFIENFHSNEDYYLNYYFTSFTRILRVLSFIITIAVPAFYIAVVAYHHEMLPTPLLINITIDRRSVPLPASIEAYIMLLVFEVLRETGIRMPSNIGQTLSIVGALVIGQAAVEAKLVAAPMIIVVASTGITGLLIPKVGGAVIYLRFYLLTLASILGLFGFVIGLSSILIHLLSLRSFGISQFTSLTTLKFQNIKDSVIRAPLWDMIQRPFKFSPNRIRQKEDHNHGT